MATRAPLSGPRRSRLRLRRPRAEVLLALFLVGFATVLEVARQPGVGSWDTIWQEDGAIFYSDAWKNPFVDTLGWVYNSYLHVVPRIIAGIVAIFPLRFASVGMTVGAALVVAALGLYVFHASRAILENTWARAALGIMIVLLPAGGYETNANIANLHWYLDYAAFWVFVANPRTRRHVVLGAVIVSGAVLSDPLVGLLFPLVLRRAWESRRDPIGLVIPALFVAFLALQLGVGYFQEPTGRNAASHWRDIPGVYALRVTGSTLVGDAYLGRFWLPLGYGFAYGSLAIVFGVLAYGFAKADAARRWFVAESAVYSVITAVVPLMLRGTENFLNKAIYSLNGSRYTVLPIMFLVGALIQVFDLRDRRVPAPSWRYVQIGFATFLAALLLTSFGVGTVRSAGPSWKGQLVKARKECRARAAGKPVDELNALPSAPGEDPTPPDDIRIGVSPFIPENGEIPFAATLPCKDLR